MARIRTIKPEFCTSAQVVECSRNARLLFVLMWMHCDDNGVHPANAKQLRMECFPGDDDMTAAVVRGLVDELVTQGLLDEYEVDGQRFWHVTGWKHQRIDKPQPGKYPTPDKRNSERAPSPVGEHSQNNSTNTPGALPPEGKGKERKDIDPPDAGAPPLQLVQPKKPAEPKATPRKTEMPKDFAVSDRVRAWALEKGHDRLDEHLDSFRRKVAARGYRYVDWDAAFMEAIRED